MKVTTATLAPLAFLMSSAFADESHQATTSGTLTLQIVRPAVSDDDSEEAQQRNLETCGSKWNAKLKAYQKELAQTKLYRTYWETWKNSPAQRPPELPLPVLTRASYRQCMAQCLEGAGPICPGGWPDEKFQR
jgi:hypothetical protein